MFALKAEFHFLFRVSSPFACPQLWDFEYDVSALKVNTSPSDPGKNSQDSILKTLSAGCYKNKHAGTIVS